MLASAGAESLPALVDARGIAAPVVVAASGKADAIVPGSADVAARGASPAPVAGGCASLATGRVNAARSAALGPAVASFLSPSLALSWPWTSASAALACAVDFSPAASRPRAAAFGALRAAPRRDADDASLVSVSAASPEAGSA